jgi:hypothetical protein
VVHEVNSTDEYKGILVCSPDEAQRNPGIQCKPECPGFTLLHPGYEADSCFYIRVIRVICGSHHLFLININIQIIIKSASQKPTIKKGGQAALFLT